MKYDYVILTSMGFHWSQCNTVIGKRQIFVMEERMVLCRINLYKSIRYNTVCGIISIS